MLGAEEQCGASLSSHCFKAFRSSRSAHLPLTYVSQQPSYYISPYHIVQRGNQRCFSLQQPVAGRMAVYVLMATRFSFLYICLQYVCVCVC